MKLEEIRGKIDNIDSEILHLLSIRFYLAKKANKVKSKLKLPIIDLSREKEIIKKLEDKSKDFNLSAKFVLSIFKEIISESKRLQKIERDKH